MTLDTAESHTIYMEMQLQFPTRGLRIKSFINQVHKMNGYVKFLPCLKDVDGSPAQLERMDKPFMDLALCNIVLQAILYPFVSAYWANKGDHHFPVDIKVMAKDLALIKPKFKCTQGFIEKIANGIRMSMQKKEPENEGR